MKKVIICVGLPASGKSTWALNKVTEEAGRWVRVNKDSLRAMCHNSKFSRDNEKFILNVRDSIILSALDSGKHVIVDDTNLAKKHIERITQLVKGKAQVEVNDSFLSVPVEDCIARDLKRLNSVGKDVILRMYRQFLRPEPLVIEHDESLPDAIIVDMDGTLSLMGDRSPYDASTCDQDAANMPVLETVLMWQETHSVIIMSGRTDDARKQTIDWLERHGVNFSGLHMRKTGDMRKDTVVKEELYRANVEGDFNIRAVFDDRKSVVEMWRSLGLLVFQVAEGDF